MDKSVELEVENGVYIFKLENLLKANHISKNKLELFGN